MSYLRPVARPALALMAMAQLMADVAKGGFKDCPSDLSPEALPGLATKIRNPLWGMRPPEQPHTELQKYNTAHKKLGPRVAVIATGQVVKDGAFGIYRPSSVNLLLAPSTNFA